MENDCRTLVGYSTSLFNTVSILLRRLFTGEEIVAHSVPGKASNSKTVVKLKFDGGKLELLEKLAMEMHNEAMSSQITAKIRAVKKRVGRESFTQENET